MPNAPDLARKYDRLYAAALVAILVGSLAVTVFAVGFRGDKRILTGDANAYYAWRD